MERRRKKFLQAFKFMRRRLKVLDEASEMIGSWLAFKTHSSDAFKGTRKGELLGLINQETSSQRF